MAFAWVIVADAAKARVFSRKHTLAGLEELESLVNPLASMPGRDLVTDRPGRTHDRSGANRHAMEPPTDVRKLQAEAFAKELAQKIEQGRSAGQFEELVLVAPPAFLGALRKELSSNSERLVSLELNKELVQATPDEIARHLA